MNYTKVTIYGKTNENEALMSALEELGISGFSVEDPADVRELMEKKHSYDWDYVDPEVLALETQEPRFSFYLEDSPEGMDLLDAALSEADYRGAGRVEISSVAEEDWRDCWKQYFKPARISRRFTVKPSWEEYIAEDPDEKIIEIDPGQAFGTGTHPTTTLCLKLLEDYLKPGESRVLDVGCGSGILSVGASLLGAKRVLGVEIDPVACAVARENAARNGVSVEIREGDLVEGVEERADVVLANLMADLVLRLADSVPRVMAEGSVFISSGILLEKEETVAEGLKAKGFVIERIEEEGDWCAIAARRKE